MLQFRHLQQRDFASLGRLHQKVFGTTRKDEFWRWKYLQNPAGEQLMAVCELEGKIIGQVGTIPFKMKVGKEEIIGAQCQDILIDKNYRKGGIFFKLEKLARSFFIPRHICFSYGFAIELTRRISTKFLGYKDIGRIEKLVKPLKISPYLHKIPFLKGKLGSVLDTFFKARLFGIKRIKLPSGWRLEQIKKFDKRFDDFWVRVKDDYPPVMVVRDSAYLNWRYSLHPEVKYTSFAVVDEHDNILGFIVLEVKEKIRGFASLEAELRDVKRGEIVDILVASQNRDKIYNILLACALRYFEEADVDVVSCWAVEGNHLYAFLQKKGFIKRSTPHSLIVREEIPNCVSKDLIFTYSNWYITRGDSDHY
jgi:hypothetical protein